jgi:hypothetical protein
MPRWADVRAATVRTALSRALDKLVPDRFRIIFEDGALLCCRKVGGAQHRKDQQNEPTETSLLPSEPIK